MLAETGDARRLRRYVSVLVETIDACSTVVKSAVVQKKNIYNTAMEGGETRQSNAFSLRNYIKLFLLTVFSVLYCAMLFCFVF